MTDAPTGLALPLRKVPWGYFTPRSRVDVAWSNIVQDVFTPQGSQPNNRSDGSGLYLLVFDPSDEFLAHSIIQCIRDAASRRNEVTVKTVTVTYDETRARANVTVVLAMPGIPKDETRSIDVPLSTRNIYQGSENRK